MWHKESFNFDRKKIVVYFERLENVGDKLNYLHWVKYEYLIRPPRIDCNVGLKPKFEEYIDNLRKSISYEEEVYIEGIKRKPVEYEKINDETDLAKEIPSKGLKKLAKDVCEKLIEQGKITEVLFETKLKREISKLVVNEIKKEGYAITKKNENSISDYYRKFNLQIKKDKDGKLHVKVNKIVR